jgi:hypothetical protein
MNTRNLRRVWVVVHVQSGIPVGAEVFQDKAEAVKLERRLNREIREEYDAVGLFETKVNSAPS